MPRQTKDVVKPTLIDSFCFGLPPGVFLKRELTLSSERRIIAKRLFIMLMVISFVGATLHVQHELVQSVVIVLIYGQTMTNTVSGFASSLTLVKLSIIAALINIVTIVLWTDQPWFLLPWSFACLMVLLCHARINRLANILPLLFVMSVLYSPSHPSKSLESALWLIPSMALMSGGLIMLALWLLWPQRPLPILKSRLENAFAGIDARLEKILTRAGNETGDGYKAGVLSKPGTVTECLTLLSQAEKDDASLANNRLDWADLILEVDTWFTIVSEIDRVLTIPSANAVRPEHVEGQALTGLARTEPAHTKAVSIAPSSKETGLNPAERERLEKLRWDAERLRTAFMDESTANMPEKRPVLSVPSPPVGEGQGRGLHQEDIASLTDPHDDQTTITEESLRYLIQRGEDAAIRIEHALKRVFDEDVSQHSAQETRVPESVSNPLAWLTANYWKDHQDTVHWALKSTVAVIIALLIVQSLNWSGIDTAIMTCVLMIDRTLGAGLRKCMMRILGALIGGLFAFVYLIVLQPATTTIAGYLLTIAPFFWISAWVSSGSPRVAYIGVQVGLAFALAVQNGDGSIADMTTAANRVLGILLGIVLVGLVDYFLWPKRSVVMSSQQLAALFRKMAEFMQYDPDTYFNRRMSATLLAHIDSTLQESQYLLEHAGMEPGADEARHNEETLETQLIIHSLQRIAKIIQARHRYFLSEQYQPVLMALKPERDGLRKAYVQYYSALAEYLEQGVPFETLELEAAYMNWRRAANALLKSGNVGMHNKASLAAMMDLERKLVSTELNLATRINVHDSESLPGRFDVFSVAET